jgi:hypothetical protein
MRHIHKADSGKLLLQMPEIDVSKMSASENGNMISRGEIALKKTSARFEVWLPVAAATEGSVANGDLLGEESAGSCTQRGRGDAPFE